MPIQVLCGDPETYKFYTVEKEPVRPLSDDRVLFRCAQPGYSAGPGSGYRIYSSSPAFSSCWTMYSSGVPSTPA